MISAFGFVRSIFIPIKDGGLQAFNGIGIRQENLAYCIELLCMSLKIELF